MFLHLCFCVYVYVYVFLCLCFCVYVSVSMFLCLCFFVYVSLSMFLCLCFCVYVSLSMFLCLCFFVYVWVSMFLCLCFCVYPVNRHSTGSGDWLDALPLKSIGLKLDNESVRVAAGLRLGAALVHPHRCVCEALVLADGHHGLACRKSAGRHSRHNQINDIVQRAFSSASVIGTRACRIVYIIIFIACMLFYKQFLLVQLTFCQLLISSLDSLDIYEY